MRNASPTSMRRSSSSSTSRTRTSDIFGCSLHGVGLRACGQVHAHLRTRTRLAVQLHEATRLRGEAVHLAQAQSAAPADFLGGEERFGRTLDGVGVHTRAVVD